MCEVEPVGLMETLVPGETASFSVGWWLLDVPTGKSVDPVRVAAIVGEQCQQEGG